MLNQELLTIKPQEVWKNFNISKKENNYIIRNKNNYNENIEKLLINFENKKIKEIIFS